LVDSHFHATYCGHVGVQQLEWPASLEYSAVRAGANAALVLSAGCTSVMDVGCRGNIGVAVQQAVAEGSISGPHIRTSGQILATAPMDAWPANFHIDSSTRLFAFVAGVDEVRAQVRLQAKAGVDNVKMQITRSAVQATKTTSALFTVEELDCAVQTAHENGLSIAAHAEGPAGVTAAIKAGFDTIQHSSFIDSTSIDHLETHPQSRIVFTLGVYADIVRNGPQFGYPPDAIQRVKDVWPRMVDAVRLAHQRGVPFGMGSDGGGRVHPQGSYAAEAVLLVNECGLTAVEAIRAATLHSANAAWIEQVGAVTPGWYADLVVVRGDLTRSIDAIAQSQNLAIVVKHGRIVSSSLTPVEKRLHHEPATAGSLREA
jgi:imidazolonepropionase-like amidohydrolase